ncbi:hypothetical protein CDD82_3482 [Ophiocordyceps australis]|uniref:ABC transporter n=1 Tax=Ophiocordyceps australis TaxID=1399860 RepID=A0A2C5ZE89_9HYPO|nr:hypothetical protein CDD82_3482 [Ophiocordyceps australis]
MTSHHEKGFGARKWYRKVPFVSTRPIEQRLTACGFNSTLSTGSIEDGVGSSMHHETGLPESTAGWLSYLTFSWLSPLLRTGYTRPLQAHDLYAMPSHRLAQHLADKLEQRWTAELERNRSRAASSWPRPFWMTRTSDTTVLALALNGVCSGWFWLGGLFKLAADLSQIVSPLLIRFLIASLADSSHKAQRIGFCYVVGLFFLLVASVTANVHGFYRSYTTGILLRGALMHLIYRRATMQLTERARLEHGWATGKLMSLMSADVTRVDFCCGFLHSAWTSMLQMLLCFVLTVYTMGYSALPGFGLLLLLYPLQTFIMHRLLRLRRASMPLTDERVQAVVEAVSTIRLVKTNTYEKSLLARIGKLRSDEVVFIRKRMLLRALNTAASYTAPTLAAVLSIVCYGATRENNIEASVIFSALTSFLLLRTPLQALPTALSAITDARAALERLAAFMVATEPETMGDSLPGLCLEPKAESDVVVEIDNATWTYHNGPEAMTGDVAVDGQGEPKASCATMRLHVSSLVVRRNQLVCIVGPVASGKSSVLRALLGDMELVEALSYQLKMDTIGLVPQTAWLLSETVRDNIVFGRRFDGPWYGEVLLRACLDQDLKQLPEGDMTVVGEMGVGLSGGQKQRISLARAIYGRSRLLLLDDCFSALDAQVGACVFDRAIGQARSNKEATIILVTHSVALARQADHVVYMEQGQIVQQGSFDLISGGNSPFSLFVEAAAANRQKHDAKVVTAREEHGHGHGTGARETKQQSRGSRAMQSEERLVGSVSLKTYMRYVMQGKAWLTVPALVLSIIVFQGTSIVSPLWLSWWQKTKYTSVSHQAYMGGYVALGLSQSLGLLSMSATFAFFCLWSSNKLHGEALASIMNAPLAFFDTTPQGRITHRFSKDLDAVDNVVGETLRLFVSSAAQAIGTVLVVAVVLPPFAAMAVVLLLVYAWTGMYYRPSARELGRLNNLLRSRIYEHFAESLSGLPTLKAFGAVPRFVRDNARRIDRENTAYWLSVASQRWLNLRLDLYGTLLVLAAGLLVVGLGDWLDPSYGGVVLSYLVAAQAVFGNMIRQSAEIESKMNSVERMLHYAYNVEQEPARHVDAVDKALVARGWPRAGRVEIKSLTLSHGRGLEPALKDITLDIEPGDKVGIVGRTGAGKTTLVSALLRMTEATSGRILVDGVNVSTVGLHLLRSSLSVISQDAMLLAGTIRYNLDPLQQYQDDWLNQCLTRVGLLPPRFALDSPVEGNGANMSQGQRCLLSMARALVRRSKLVIFDEATASIDGKADAKLQDMLKQVMRDATMLIVAHRLDTIVGMCDQVVVMDRGRIVELGPMTELVSRPDSLFRRLYDAAGIAMRGSNESKGQTCCTSASQD